MSNGHLILTAAIRPALLHLAEVDGYRQIVSPAAEELLLGIAAAESEFRHKRQIGGPALGYFQIEPATHHDVLDNFVSFRPPLKGALDALLIGAVGRDMQIATNDVYAAAVARLVLWRAPERLPNQGDVAGYARYWKKHYNTAEGRGTEEHFVRCWDVLVRPILGGA